LGDGRTVADLPHATSSASTIMAAMAHDASTLSADGMEHG
jgi:hypothetical protein